MKRCTKCLLPETVETIEFNDNGCNICHSNVEIKEKIDWKKREKDLLNLIKKFKGKYDYDCIIPFSGGKDSTYQLYYVKKILKLKPLVIRFNHGFLRKVIKDNTEKVLKKLGVDFIEFTPNWKIVKKLMLESFIRKTDFCWHCHTGIYSYPTRLAIKLNIPLIIWGEPTAEFNAYYDYNEMEVEDEEKFDRVHNLGISAEDMFGMINSEDDPIDKRDLIPYTYPSREEYSKSNITSIELGSYIRWDYHKQFKIINEELGWQTDELEGVPNEAHLYGSKIECFMQGSRDYVKFLKRGYSRVSQNVAYEIRNKNISLEEAKKLITEDGKKPPSLDVFLEYVGLTEKEFNEIITNQVIPPNQPNFERNEFAKKTHDFNDWYREDNRKNDSDN
jgi:N-acetyl sugar amidotransferase